MSTTVASVYPLTFILRQKPVNGLGETQMARWQHRVPVRVDEPGYHEEEVKPENLRGLPDCKWCGKRIIRVDENEGPENLKALLRF